jgi:hypothetical protein
MVNFGSGVMGVPFQKYGQSLACRIDFDQIHVSVLCNFL